jgi:hypothetical protein
MTSGRQDPVTAQYFVDAHSEHLGTVRRDFEQRRIDQGSENADFRRQWRTGRTDRSP